MPNVREKNPSNRKSEYILVTMHTEINGKMIPTNQLMTWAYQNYIEDPFERMVKHSKLFILHQDPLFREESLAECTRLFVEILETGKSLEEKDLKEKMALFRYIFAHGMPYQRGSAAIGEWLEMAIYRHLGFSCSQPNREEPVDLAALTCFSFAEYLKKYNELTQISFLNERKSVIDLMLRLKTLASND